MDYLYGLIEGLLAGLGGFLPISSSGHRLIFGELLSLPANEGVALFAELGALIAAILCCRKTLLGMLRGIGSAAEKAKKGKFRWKKAPRELLLLCCLLIACIPPAAAVIVRFFYDYTATIGNSLQWAAAGFFLNAVLIFIGAHSKCNYWGSGDLSGGQAFKLGLFRAIAGILPGLSPFGASASMGMNMGFEPGFAAEFSVLLAIPSLLGSILLRLFGIGGWSGFTFPGAAIAFVAAVMAGILAILLIRKIVKDGRFGLLMYYPILAGIAALIL